MTQIRQEAFKTESFKKFLTGPPLCPLSMVEGWQTDESQTLQDMGQSKIPELDCLGTAHSVFKEWTLVSTKKR